MQPEAYAQKKLRQALRDKNIKHRLEEGWLTVANNDVKRTKKIAQGTGVVKLTTPVYHSVGNKTSYLVEVPTAIRKELLKMKNPTSRFTVKDLENGIKAYNDKFKLTDETGKLVLGKHKTGYSVAWRFPNGELDAFSGGYTPNPRRAYREMQMEAAMGGIPPRKERGERMKTNPTALTSYKIVTESGYSWTTDMAPGVTLAKAKEYFLGKKFDVKAYPKKKMEKVVKVIQLKGPTKKNPLYVGAPAQISRKRGGYMMTNPRGRFTQKDLEEEVEDYNRYYKLTNRTGKFEVGAAYGGYRVQWRYPDTSVDEITVGYDAPPRKVFNDFQRRVDDEVIEYYKERTKRLYSKTNPRNPKKGATMAKRKMKKKAAKKRVAKPVAIPKGKKKGQKFTKKGKRYTVVSYTIKKGKAKGKRVRFARRIKK